MAVKRLINARVQYQDNNGALASGYRLWFYAAGSSTKQNTYNDSTGGVANSNPIVLNALGEPAVEIWLTAGLSYKMGLSIAGSDDPPAAFIWTEDNITGVNDSSVSLDQWVAGPAPTYISATSFSLVGDQTSTFTIGRRLKTTNSGGTVYSTISVSAYAALTTVTVVNDSGTLDAGLSAVSYGLLSAVNPSVPTIVTAGTGIAVTNPSGRPTIAVSITPITNSLSGDVALNNASNYFTGPTVAQGTSGTWFASGTIVVQDTGGGANFDAKLWDGTTVIASGDCNTTTANQRMCISLSGFLANPAGNIRISAKSGSTSATISYNLSGNSKDCTLTVFRVV